MATRLGFVWVLQVAVTLGVPAVTWGQETAKEQVLALSRTIDTFIAAKQKAAGVTPAPRADDSTYFRRLNLDLVGRIPLLIDHRDFLDNPDPDKRWEWVERFLSNDPETAGAPPTDKQFGPFTNHWANILRTHILGSNVQPQFGGLAANFELWLKERMQANAPFDRVVHELLTAGTTMQNMAFQGGQMAASASPAAFYFINENKPENLAAATTRKFLGVKLECAQCHAHPFAKWSREHFWEFAAFFAGMPNPNVRGGIQPVATPVSGPREIKIPGTDKVVKAKFLGGREPVWKDGGDSSRMVLADWLTAADNPYFARATVDLVWSYFFGISLLEPIMEPSDDSPVTYAELLDEMARQFTAHGSDLKFLIRAIVHTEAYQRVSTGTAAASPDDYNLFVRMPVRGLTPAQLFDSVMMATYYKGPGGPNAYPQMFGGPALTPRAQFLNKFTTQERRHETQTSILQALFMMNGKFLAEQLQPENNESLTALLRSRQTTSQRIDSLYIWVLSRLPRPEESERLVRYVDSGGPMGDPRRAMADVYWALLNSAEFMLNH